MWKNINGLQFLVLFADNEKDAKEKFRQWEDSTTGEWYNEMNSKMNVTGHTVTFTPCESQPTSSKVLFFVLSEYT